MKPLEPGCWAIVIPGHGENIGILEHGSFVKVIDRMDDPNDVCDCVTWELDVPAPVPYKHVVGGACGLMRIDDYDGDGREWYENIRRKLMEAIDA